MGHTSVLVLISLTNVAIRHGFSASQRSRQDFLGFYFLNESKSQVLFS